MVKTSKINFKICRSFSLGFSIHSPKLNGLSIEIYLTCFHICIWGKGEKWFSFNNYWSS